MDPPGDCEIAEELTAWPGVSQPVSSGRTGVRFQVEHGFHARHPQVYLARDPIYRKYSHDEITFGLLYAFTENFVLPLSHDEVVHGKGSLLRKMAGDPWQSFDSCAPIYGADVGYPGKKLLFMGQEFASWDEWNAQECPPGACSTSGRTGVGAGPRPQHFYRATPALYARDCEPEGFRWTVVHDDHIGVRFPGTGAPVTPRRSPCNFTPEPRYNYRVGLPYAGHWREALNSDSASTYEDRTWAISAAWLRKLRASHGFPTSAALDPSAAFDAVSYLQPAGRLIGRDLCPRSRQQQGKGGCLGPLRATYDGLCSGRRPRQPA